MESRLPGLFVVGTDTGVGKTFVASAIVRALRREGRRVGALKPVATGAIREGEIWRSDDAEELINALGGDVPIEHVVPILYEEPLAPCVAARRTGTELEQKRIEREMERALAGWSERGAEVVVVEGVGGLLCPLAEGTTVADLAVTFDFPLVIVARLGLGTLNHTLLTVEAAQRRSLRIAGVILNTAEPPTGSVAEATNAQELARRLPGLAILGPLPYRVAEDWSDPVLEIDWFERARSSRLLGSPPGEVGPGGPQNDVERRT